VSNQGPLRFVAGFAVVILVSVTLVALIARRAEPERRDPSVFRGLGAWVDVYDYAPAYDRPQEGAHLVPEDMDAMAARGVRTVYVQAARLDERSPGGIVDAPLLARFLGRAHKRGLRVVGWYLPKFGDVEADLANLRLLRDFKHDGQRFDGIGVDIEWRRDVPDAAERNGRLVDLSSRFRREGGGPALAAIVYPPVLLESVYPTYWPDFPWSQLARSYDAWLPMTYWTETPARSVYRDAYRYTEESVRLLRLRLDDASALVHPVGGTAGPSKADDYEGFVTAARETGTVGLSVYDYLTTTPAGWDALKRAAP